MNLCKNIFLLLVFSFAAPILADEPKPTISLVSDQEIIAELRAAPRDNQERVQKLRELYLQAGAQPDQIRLQEVKANETDDKPQHNVIVTKPGTSDSVIVVGGHLDKVADGDGIIDDWSGASLATNLFQTIRPLDTTHTFVFIGFAHEEIGLVGSRAYVDSLSDKEKGKIKAMINLECLGADDPFIWTNGSTDSLEIIARRVAREHNLPLRDHKLFGVGADSIPFDRVGIPNITFDGLAVEHFALIHSDRDTFENINQSSYLNAYRLTSRFLLTLDRTLAESPGLLTALDPRTTRRVDEYVQAEMKKRHIPGLSIAVVQNGEVLLAKGYGLANVELSVPATAETVYQIGSITKQFTATAIMMLVEDGKLSLDDPIARHLTDSPDTWKDVTVRNLLNHTSGIKSYTSIADNMKKSRLDRGKADIIGTVRELPLEFQPGEKWSYNNTGFFLLGQIVEQVSGKPYAEFLAERIFRLLEMNATRVNRQMEVTKNRATGYGWGKLCPNCGVRVTAAKCGLCDATVPADSQPESLNAESTSMTWPFAAGAIISTVADLAKWDAALYTERVLPASILEQMWTPTKLAGGRTQDYGFGWAVGNFRGHRLIGHGGGIAGFSTDLVRFVEDKLTVIVLTNLEGANPASLARGIAAFYIPDLAQSADKPIADRDPKTTQLFKGVLQATIDGKLDPELFTPEMRMEIFPDRINQATQFLAQLGPYKSFTLVEHKPEGTTQTFRYKIQFGEINIILTGILNDTGKIAGMTLTPE